MPSDVWNFFTRVNDSLAKCNLCLSKLSYKTTVTNLKTHLKRKHVGTYTSLMNAPSTSSAENIDDPPALNQDSAPPSVQDSAPPSVQDSAPPSVQNSAPPTVVPAASDPSSSASAPTPRITSGTTSNSLSDNLSTPTRAPLSSAGGNKRRQQSTLSNFVPKRMRPNERKAIDRDLMNLFILDFQPFSIVEDQGFRNFVKWIPGYELPSRKKVSSVMLPAMYHKAVNNIKDMVMEEADTICITTDCWTSAATESYIAISGHYISKNFEFKSVLIKCGGFLEQHTSANIAAELKSVLSDWRLYKKVNFAVSDNASNMTHVFDTFLLWNSFGCYAHSLNLIVQKAIKEASSVLESVKKIVGHCKRSTTAMQKILQYQIDRGTEQPKRLLQDVPTRWNSTYYMIRRFVELEEAVDGTVLQFKRNLPIISIEEWALLKELVEILAPFEEITTTIIGEKYISGSLVIVVTRTLTESISLLERKIQKEEAKNVLKTLKDGIKEKFAMIEHNSTFAVCTLLDPRYKSGIFKDPVALDKGKKSLKSLLVAKIEKEIRNRPPVPQSNTNPIPCPSTSTGTVSALSVLRNLVGDAVPTANATSRAIKEFDAYFNDDRLSSDPSEKRTPLDWWREHRFHYPHLAAIYREKCNIVASSVPCERYFSKAGQIINDRRTRLKTTTVEQLMFLNVNANYVGSLSLD